jgi:hypothetical protein
MRAPERADDGVGRANLRRYVPVLTQLLGVAAVAVGFGLLAVWAGLVAGGLGLLAFGIAAELAG